MPVPAVLEAVWADPNGCCTTIQELLGRNIETTMIYLPVLKEIAPKPPVSPLDIVWE